MLIGRFKWDVYVRLTYANIPKDKIILTSDLNELIPTIKEKTKGNIYTMVCFDMTAIITGLVKEYENGKM